MMFSPKLVAGWLFCLVSITVTGEITREPYLQLSTPDSITVVWRCDTLLDNPGVKFGKEIGKLDQVTAGNSIRVRTTEDPHTPLFNAPEGTVQYEATLSGLEAHTRYFYDLVDGDTSITHPEALPEEFQFRTHPSHGTPTPTRIWVVGDSGTGSAHQAAVHEGMLRWTAETKRPIDLYLHVGDMAYGSGTDEQFQERFFAPYAPTLAQTVCWAAMGNHEGKTSDGETGIGPFYDAYVCPTKAEAGGTPSGKESFYSFDYGDAHIIALNSYDIDRSPTGEMAQWLARDLAATKARWRIAFFHHPPYTKGSHDSDKEKELIEMREWIMPILEDFGVDLVLSGHSHIYERSMLIDGAYQTPTTSEGVILNDGDGHPDGDGAYIKPGTGGEAHRGTIAIVTGHGGALVSKEKGIMPIMRSLILDHGSTILDIDGDTLTGTMLDLRAQERDRFVMIKKDGAAKAEIINQPWTPTSSDIERTGKGVAGSERNPASPAPNNILSHIIKDGAEWHYLPGGENPPKDWAKNGFDTSDWKLGRAGFGYGDDDDHTVFDDMEDNYRSIFIRSEFELPADLDLTTLGLLIDYDDGFTLWINGTRAFDKGIERNPDDSIAHVSSHEAGTPQFFPLSKHTKLFQKGTNTIALEGHNTKINSSDLTLNPQLITSEPTQ